MFRRDFLLYPALLSRAASAHLDDAYAAALASSKHGGLIVAHRGRIVYERYFGRAHAGATPNTASCGKSFTSIAAGIVLHERRRDLPLGLDQPVWTERYLPVSSSDDARKARIKLGQLLAMTAGIRGNPPGIVHGKRVAFSPAGLDGWAASVDENALAADLWCEPGEGYSYATAGVHVVSILVRRITGMDLQSFIGDRIAKPLGWRRWGWGYRRKEITHTPGGGGIALSARDMIAFCELLRASGRWKKQQLIPREYVSACSDLSPYNPHYAYSLQFNVNGDGHLAKVPRDAFWKTGSGGHCFYVVPSLELSIWKLGGRDEQYYVSNTGIPEVLPYDGSRDNWKPTIEAQPAADLVLQSAVRAFSR